MLGLPRNAFPPDESYENDMASTSDMMESIIGNIMMFILHWNYAEPSGRDYAAVMGFMTVTNWNSRL